LNLVTWEMRASKGNPRFAASQELPDFPYAEYAKSIGLRGIRVEDPRKVGQAWDEALSADRPIVLEAVTDPDVPPLPPHISLEQAKNFMTSVLKGDRGFLKKTAKELAVTALPGSGEKP
jgi:pyruvate dehydrogenase (quinone)